MRLRPSKYLQIHRPFWTVITVFTLFFDPVDEGHAERINVKYRQAQDYPVDLYYLMDLSNSMKDDKDQLSRLGDRLADTMTKMTSNFRLGFGSFVDKVVMPYVSIVPSQ